MKREGERLLAGHCGERRQHRLQRILSIRSEQDVAHLRERPPVVRLLRSTGTQGMSVAPSGRGMGRRTRRVVAVTQRADDVALCSAVVTRRRCAQVSGLLSAMSISTTRGVCFIAMIAHATSVCLSAAVTAAASAAIASGPQSESDARRIHGRVSVRCSVVSWLIIRMADWHRARCQARAAPGSC